MDKNNKGKDNLPDSERLLNDILDGSPIPQFVLGKDHMVVKWNKALEAYSGVKAGDIVGTDNHWVPFYRQKRPVMADLLIDGSIEKIPVLYAGNYSESKLLDGAYEGTDFFPCLGNNGKWLHFTASVIRDADSNIIGAVETLEDITERKQAEKALSRSNRELRAISNCNQALMRAEDEKTILKEICRIICDEAGYFTAWVGYAENDEGKTVRPVAWAGVEDENLSKVHISWADTQQGHGPTGTAIRSGQTTCIQDFMTDPTVALWLDDVLKRGYRSSISLPLKDEDLNTFGVLNIYSVEPNAFTSGEVRLMEEFAGNLAFGINVLRARIKRKQVEEERLAHLQFLESMDRVNRTMQGSNDLEQTMSDVLETMLSIFSCDRASLAYPCDPHAPFWQVKMERARPEYASNLSEKGEIPLERDNAFVFGQLISSNGPVAFGPGSDHPLIETIPGFSMQKSMIAMSLYPKLGKPWLLGMHQCSYPRVWTKEEENLFKEIGRRLSDALTSFLMYNDLCKSEAENRAIVSSVPDLLFRVRKDGTITDFRKPEGMDLYLPLEQFLGRTIIDVLPPSVSRSAIEAVDKVFKTKEIATFEYVLPIKGLLSYFEGRVAAISNDEVLTVIRDITERKQAELSLAESEAKMRSILDNIGIGVALISPGMKILELNKMMRGWLSDVDLTQSPLCYRIFNDPPREDICENCPTFKTLEDGQVHEATMETPQKGGILKTRIVSSPIFNASGEIAGAIEMVEDITEKLSLETQLRQAQKMESIGRLAGGVAHDFNNMLGVIIGYSELAIRQIQPGQPIFTNLQEIRKAALRSADLTRQLLAFARKQTIAPKVLDLNETVESMLKILRRLIGEDIDLVWQPGKNLWQVNVDPSQVDQVLANLCVNARDAITGMGKVIIETENADINDAFCSSNMECVPGKYVMLSVSDNGCGMTKDVLERLFEPFFTTKEMGKGTGLGLATVYGIVKQNNGFINVSSEPGLGASFRIYLPQHVSVKGELQKQFENEPPRGNETILLVEDERAILDMSMMMLKRLGYTVLAASTPGEAVSMAKEHHGVIHMLMSDVVMPGMTGREMAQKLTLLRPQIKHLFMSGYTSDVIAHQGVLDEDVNFIQKPFSMNDLAIKVREVLDGKRENQKAK